MIYAPTITLCCVDTAHHALSAMALRKCNAVMTPAKTVFLTDRSDCVDAGWEHHRIKPFANYREFNLFMLKNLYDHIDTDFVLVVQFDGFILHAGSWHNDFLAYDYVGAPWSWLPERYRVGNGGFSMRSRRLLRALQDPNIMLPTDPKTTEDQWICHTYRSFLEVAHQISFASPEVASRFSYEAGIFVPDTFGFHGLRLLAGIYRGEEARFLAENLQPYLLRKAVAAVLATQFAICEQYYEASLIFARIAALQTYEETLKNVRDESSAEFVGLFEDAWRRCVVPLAA